MAELRDCPTCGGFFNYTGVREVCVQCAQKEEKKYEEVYRFLRRRENRAATVERIVEVTGVTESLLHNWVRKGRLQPALFPNLGYPCDQCGSLTTSGKLCETCATALQSDLKAFEAAQEFRDAISESDAKAYYTNPNK
ncbi:TIGR03826 family flagellar region protein [Sporosarcina pasteurii]|uniref:Flagellar operon protein n=1 Tax=Sporosarcina pasteurii TaxID=1474 RepID=A0A380BDS3_SPOPA|nr:TIGR03826 family flagellar region protein [Sporosarcina pasteurii]MDS9470322.1 hypothetical protein [Sporosarcina pasteurii]QBQ05965.1 hypothetical protein E2C16_09925 [Sporosarcina pasteurii]SUI99805.1 flagellar operon protein [Sporosarcina pasteurii]